MDALLGYVAGKAADSVVSHAEPLVNKIHSTQIFDTATEQLAKQLLLEDFGDTIFYNDFDSYISRNDVIPQLIISLRGESKLQENNKKAFVEQNLKKFFALYIKYKHDITILGRIKDAFEKIFDLVFNRTLGIDHYSDIGKIQASLYSFESASKERDNETLSIARSNSEKLDQLLSYCSTTSPTSVLKTAGTDGIAPTEKYSEEVTNLTREIKSIENNLQKKGAFKEAIEEYQKLQRKIILQLRSFPPLQIDKLICSLSSNFALCYANIGKYQQAIEFLSTAPKEAAEKDKTFQYVYAAVLTYYAPDPDLEDAVIHVEKALSIDSNYHQAFLLNQLLKAKRKVLSIDDIISSINTRFLQIDLESENQDIIADCHMHKGIIFLEGGLYDKAILSFLKAQESGYDSDVVNLDIAGTYYSKAVSKIPRGIRSLLPEYDCSDLLNAINYIKPIVFPSNQEQSKFALRNRALLLYVSSCSLIGMPLALEPYELYLDNPEIDIEVKRAIILYSSGSIPEKYTSILSDEEQHFIKAKSYIQKNDSIGFKKYIEALITVNENVPAPLYNLLLQNCLVLKCASDYWKYRDNAKSAGVSDRLLCAYDADCYELENRMDLAFNNYYKIAQEETEYELLRRASFFFKRNNYINECINLLCRIDELRKRNAIYICDSDSFYSDTVYFLISNDLQRAKTMIETLDPSIVSPFVFYRLSFSVYSKYNDWKEMLHYSEKAYELSHEFPDGLNHILGLIVFQRYNDAIDATQELIQNARNDDEKIKCLWLMSDLYLYNLDYDRSFEFAKEAHLLTKNNPYEISHQAFFTRSFRTGHSEGIQDVLAFKAEHPVVTDWIKTIQLPEGEKDGEKIADMLSLAANGRLASENRRREAEKTRLYKQGILPLHFLFDSYSNSLFSITEFAKKHKLIVSEGDTNKEKKEITLLSDSLVVDAYCLIILEISGCLYLLNEISRVYIPYISVCILQRLFLSSHLGETRHIENILSWIRASNNICYEADGIQWKESKIKAVFSEDFISCCNVARRHNIPYLTCETVAKKIQDAAQCEYNDVVLVSITSVCAKVYENAPEQCANTRFKLLKYCTFISFSANDIVNTIIDNSYCITDEIVSRFMICKSTCDVASFSNVYLQTIALLFQCDETVAEEFVKIVLNNAYQVWRRGAYARDLSMRFHDEAAEYQARAIASYVVQIYYGISFLYEQMNRTLPEQLNTIHKRLFKSAVKGLAEIEIRKMLEPLINSTQ